MQTEVIERRAAETILERGVRVTLPAPRFLRMLGKKQISFRIKQPSMGILLEVSEIELKEHFSFSGIDAGDLDAAFDLVNKHAKAVAEIISLLMLGDKFLRRLYTGIFARWFLYAVSAKKQSEIALMIVVFSGVQDFINTIRLIRTMKLTSPKNLSPTNQGSQEAE